MKTQEISFSSSTDLLPYVLLIVVGCLVALMLPLANLALAEGISPLQYAFWQTLGGGMLLLVQNGRQEQASLSRVNVRYFLVSGLTAVALPNAIAFAVVTEIGAGLTATLYALPAILTYALSIALKMERFQLLRVLGIFVGVLGCIQILSPKTNGIDSATLPWLLIGLLVPFSLAIGNVYRSIAWPEGATPMQLAPGMLLGAALLLGLGLVITGDFREVQHLQSKIIAIVALQSVLTALTYRAFFELQKRTSPVFISQIGFVVTPVGLMLGVLFFDERIHLGVWLGVGILLLGLYLTNYRKQSS